MAQAEINEVLKVSFDDLFDTIVDYESYPEFVDSVIAVEILERDDKRVRAKYQVSLMKDFSYILDLYADRPNGQVQWELVESDLFETNNGKWKLSPKGKGTTFAHYELEVEFKIPV